jgi:hypothetical protein
MLICLTKVKGDPGRGAQDLWIHLTVLRSKIILS